MNESVKKNNGFYRAVWEHRKALTKTSYLAGAVVSAILTVIFAVSAVQEYGFHFEDILEWLVVFALTTLMAGSIIMVVRAIKHGSQGAAAMGAIVGLISSTIGLIAASISFAFRSPGILMVFFLFLDLFVWGVCGVFLLILFAVYAVYIPISDIYYFAKANSKSA